MFNEESSYPTTHRLCRGKTLATIFQDVIDSRHGLWDSRIWNFSSRIWAKRYWESQRKRKTRI